MSRIARFGSVVILLLFLFTGISGCRKESVTLKEKVTAQLTSAEAWDAPTVIVDGVDVSDVYKDLTISFDKETYTTAGGEPMWASSGTWIFTNDEATIMLLDGSVEVRLLSVSDQELDLERYWEETTFQPGRISSVKGKHEFKFKKEKKP